MQLHALADTIGGLLLLVVPYLWIYSGYAGAQQFPPAILVRVFGAALLFIAYLSYNYRGDLELLLLVKAKVVWSFLVSLSALLELTVYFSAGLTGPWALWVIAVVFAIGFLVWSWALRYLWTQVRADVTSRGPFGTRAGAAHLPTVPETMRQRRV